MHPVVALPIYPTGARGPNYATWPEGSLGHTFHWACSSRDLKTAAKRWHVFLDKYGSEDGRFEDAFQWRHVVYAKHELMRISYLLGKVEEGDRLLREFDPVRQ